MYNACLGGKVAANHVYHDLHPKKKESAHMKLHNFQSKEEILIPKYFMNNLFLGEMKQGQN
jgi:hypothetical protein